jgi:bifunctional UDP-N-acetylglucosamine pyrophosphorylase/glucosamine-1-phosphate N-acetyltransferase
MSSTVTAIVLAAGKGTRMHSAHPKVLHLLAGWPMIGHVLLATDRAGVNRTMVVLGHGAEEVRAALPPGTLSVVQEPQLGTGHAVRVALDGLPGADTEVALLLYGDIPLIRHETLRRLLHRHAEGGHALTLLSAQVPDPRGYGRVLRDERGVLVGIKEQKELTAAEEAIDEINGGVYAVSMPWLRRAVAGLPVHADGEYYLPDLVPVALASGGAGVVRVEDADEVQGVNTRVQLAAADALMRRRINLAHMLAGVTMITPELTYIEPGVSIGQDTVLYPNTYLRGETTIGMNCVIGPDVDLRNARVGDGSQIFRSMVEASRIGRDCLVGPFSRLRPGTVLEDGVEIGTCAEVKNSTIGAGSACHHFSYVGDTTIGSGTNIGAGAVTCNYDGVKKYPTVIGDNVFVGSGTMLRAPVTLGNGSRTGAGAVVLHDVEPGTTVAGVPARKIGQ